MPPEVEGVAAIVSSGGVVALALIVWLTLRGHLQRMEKRESRTADMMEAFVAILSRVEVRVGLDVSRRRTPGRGASRDTDPSEEG